MYASTLMPYPNPALTLSIQFSEQSLQPDPVLGAIISMLTLWILIHMVVTTIIQQCIPSIHL